MNGPGMMGYSAPGPSIMDYARDACHVIIGRLETMPAPTRIIAERIIDETLNTVRCGPLGTARVWFERNAGKNVHTLQITRADGALWIPLSRLIETRPSGVILGGSLRDYAGLRVAGVSQNCLIVENDSTVIAYTLETVEGDS